MIRSACRHGLKSSFPSLGLALALLGVFSTTSLAVANPEDWYALYIAGSKVGYLRVGSKELKHEGENYVRVNYEMVLKFQRDQDSISITQRYGTIEKPDGTVLKLDSRALTGRDEMRAFGDVVDGKMNFTFDIGGKTTHKEIAWGDDVRGPYGAETSLEREPLKPGETRAVKVFIPQLNEICVDEMTARGLEDVVIGGRKEKLLRIDVKGKKLDGKAQTLLDQTIWVDDHGKIGKSFTDAFGGFTSVRTTKAFATAPSTGKALDLNKQTIIKVSRKITEPTQRKSIAYRFRMRDGKPVELFPKDDRQTVTPGDDDHTALVTIHTIGPNDGAAGPEKVSPEYLRSNPMIDSDDPGVIALARQATATATSPWDKAVAIERWVNDNMKEVNYKTAFAPATEVAKSLAGDCTEHAVLVAAMCRASGIPTRVATGLLYAEPANGFGFHMWNEVYINRRWVPIDAVFRQDVIDPTHVKLSDSSLDGVSPFDGLLIVEQVSNHLVIDILEIH